MRPNVALAKLVDFRAHLHKGGQMQLDIDAVLHEFSGSVRKSRMPPSAWNAARELHFDASSPYALTPSTLRLHPVKHRSCVEASKPRLFP